MRPPFPSVVDSTILTTARACHRKVELEHFQHWKLNVPNIHLHAGAAYARGLEVARRLFYEQNWKEEDAIAEGQAALMQAYGDFQAPPDSNKSLPRMMGALDYYFERYPMATDLAKPTKLPSGKLGIEFSFVSPLNYRHPETGDPVMFCGRTDMLADYAGGVWLEDDKTTSQLGASWARQWELRFQFTGYCWLARQFGIPVRGVLVRGISILKTKYDTLECTTYRPDWMVDRWYQGALRSLASLERSWREGVFDLNESESCTSYGGCPFAQVCVSEDPTPWLNQSYTRRRWEPLTRQEIPLE